MSWQSQEDMEQVSSVYKHLGWGVAVSLTLFLLWAIFAQLDIFAVTSGSVIPANRVQTIQHLEGGIVRKLLIEEGQEVKQGQPLVVMENTADSSDYGSLSAQMRTLIAQVVQYEAEDQAKKTLVFDAEFESINEGLVNETRNLFYSRRSKYAAGINSLEQEVTIRQQEMKLISARLKHARERLVLIKEQIDMGKKLLANDLSNRYEQIDRLKESNELESIIAENEFTLTRNRAAHAQASQTMAVKVSEYKEEVQARLLDARKQLEETQEQLKQYTDSLSRTEVKSPVDGLVKTIFVVTEGGVVPPGGPILEIVPQNDRLIIEVNLLPQDVGHVQTGQMALVRLASSESSRLGYIQGKVIQISPDSYVNEKDGSAFFRVRIETDKSYFGEGGERYELLPGVMVTAAIVTGERTVLEYIVSPFMQNMAFSMGER